MNESNISVGDTVKLILQPPYFKTADPLTMLRPPDIIPVGEIGLIIDRRSTQYWVVKFTRGNFLVESRFLAVIPKHSITG